MLSKSSGSPVATTRTSSLHAIGIILKRRASCGLISSITSCGTTVSARSIHCICACVARLREISSAETLPCPTSSSTTLVEPSRLALASSICGRVTSPASRRRSRTYSSFGGDICKPRMAGGKRKGKAESRVLRESCHPEPRRRRGSSQLYAALSVNKGTSIATARSFSALRRFRMTGVGRGQRGGARFAAREASNRALSGS